LCGDVAGDNLGAAVVSGSPDIGAAGLNVYCAFAPFAVFGQIEPCAALQAP